MKKILLLCLTLPNLLQSSSGSPAQTSAAGAPELAISAQKSATQTKEVAAFKNILPVPDLQKLVIDYLGIDYKPRLQFPVTSDDPDNTLSWIDNIAVSPNGKWIAVHFSCSDKKGKSVDLIGVWQQTGTSFTKITEFETPRNGSIENIAISSDGRHIAAGFSTSGKRVAMVFIRHNDGPISAHTLKQDEYFPFSPLFFQRNNTEDLIFLSNYVDIFEKDSNNLFTKVKSLPISSQGFTQRYTAGDVSTDGEKIILGTNHYNIVALSRENQSDKFSYSEVARYTNDQDRTSGVDERDLKIHSIAISPDKKYVAAASNHKLRILKFENNKFELLQEIPVKHEQYTQNVSYVKFSKNGLLCFVTHIPEQAIHIWKKGPDDIFKPMQKIETKTAPKVVAFVPDDSYIIGSAHGKEITIWRDEVAALQNKSYDEMLESASAQSESLANKTSEAGASPAK